MRQRSILTSVESRLIDISALMAYTGLGRNNAMKWAEEVGAKRKIGRRCLYDRKVIDDALDKMEA